MKNIGSVKKRRWVLAWIMQIVVMAVVCALAALSEGAQMPVRILMLWLVTPLTGGITAFIAVRRGLLNYVAWIAPPVVHYIVYLMLWGYVPPVSSALLCALISLIGAAAGEVSSKTK